MLLSAVLPFCGVKFLTEQLCAIFMNVMSTFYLFILVLTDLLINYVFNLIFMKTSVTKLSINTAIKIQS